MVFHSIGNADLNGKAIERALISDKKKTLIIPSGSKIKISEMIDIGSNTTIIAKGATIIQTRSDIGVMRHEVDGGNYNSIKNVKIVGGTWKNAANKNAYSMFRFAHGANLTFQNMTIETNYKGHGLELIACKNVLVKGCKIVATNNKTKSSTSVEEALQIDIATASTAPGISFKKAYVKGQICQNIKIINSTIRGSRGICTNFSSGDKKYLNRFHRNITIQGCKITGTSAEGLALLNSVGCKVKNNKIISNSSRSSTPYGDACHMTLVGSSSISTKYKNVITKNTIYGKFYGIDVTSSTGCKFGPTTVTGNKVYSSGGAGRCIRVNSCVRSNVSKNSCKRR
jgi:parallel beta-helix repeat protein